MTNNNIATPNAVRLKDMPKQGKTSLSVKSVNGNLYIVDQDGLMIQGLMSCSAKSGVDCITEITLTCASFDNEL